MSVHSYHLLCLSPVQVWVLVPVHSLFLNVLKTGLMNEKSGYMCNVCSLYIPFTCNVCPLYIPITHIVCQCDLLSVHFMCISDL